MRTNLHAPPIVKRMTDLIGNTPLLDLPLRASAWRVLLKLEQFNPGRSMKDRMARAMVDDAEERGLLGSGGTIVESSSGNTGAGLALVAAERGYRFVAIVDCHASAEKIAVMRAYGAEIVYADDAVPEGRVATKAREALAERIAGEIPSAVYLRQPDNPANARAYHDSLANELWAGTGGALRALFGAVGTGGSLSGTARRLKTLHPGVIVVGVEPEGSIIFGGPGGAYYQSGTGTPEGVEIGKNVDFLVLDHGCKVSDACAFTTARVLARRGLLVGGSAGGVIYRALDWMSQRSDEGVLVVIVADGGEKYLDTVFDDAWTSVRGLHDAQVEDRVRCWLADVTPRT